jgi:hypothetical protein
MTENWVANKRRADQVGNLFGLRREVGLTPRDDPGGLRNALTT